MIVVLLDTNFLMALFQLKLDIFSEIQRIMNQPYKLAIIDKTQEELVKITGRSRSEAIPAKFALFALKKEKIKILPTKDGFTDDILAEMGNSDGYLLATNDKELKSRVKRAIYVRKKKYLEMKGNVL